MPPYGYPLGLDEHANSSSVVQRIVSATARFCSFCDATDAVGMSGISISESQVRRLAHEIGQELIDQRDREAVEHRRRKLVPRTEVVPAAVVVEVDGGRIRTRASGAGPGGPRGPEQGRQDRLPGHPGWPRVPHRPVSAPPESFVCPRRVQRLVAGMKGRTGEAEGHEISEGSVVATGADVAAPPEDRWSPARRVRPCVASVGKSSAFGPLVAAEAQRRGFYQAKRRAFVADGLGVQLVDPPGVIPGLRADRGLPARAVLREFVGTRGE